MNDDRLVAMLGQLHHERLDRIADDKIRARLENAWTSRAERRSAPFALRRFAPAVATIVLMVGVGTSTMSAAGDSPLYGVRVAIENASVALHIDPHDRRDFLMGLLDQRQAEAARLEAIGNAAAASKARAIERETLAMARSLDPEGPGGEAVPQPAPSSTPTPSATPTPNASPSPSPSPTPSATQTTTATAAPPATTRPAPTPVRTPTPTAVPTATPKPTPTVAGTPFLVKVKGIVKNSDGTVAQNVCVWFETSPSGACTTTTLADGTYVFSISGRLNQTYTVKFTRQDGSILWKAQATFTVKGSVVDVVTVKLAK